MKRERKDMPRTARLVAELRKRWGLMPTDLKVRAAMHGRPGFYARENGEEFGTHMPKGSVEIYKDLYLVSQVRPQFATRQPGQLVWFEVEVGSPEEAAYVMNLLMVTTETEPAGPGEQQSQREK